MAVPQKGEVPDGKLMIALNDYFFVNVTKSSVFLLDTGHGITYSKLTSANTMAINTV